MVQATGLVLPRWLASRAAPVRGLDFAWWKGSVCALCVQVCLLCTPSSRMRLIA
jgi:hypothetical protein